MKLRAEPCLRLKVCGWPSDSVMLDEEPGMTGAPPEKPSSHGEG